MWVIYYVHLFYRVTILRDYPPPSTGEVVCQTRLIETPRCPVLPFTGDEGFATIFTTPPTGTIRYTYAKSIGYCQRHDVTWV